MIIPEGVSIEDFPAEIMFLWLASIYKQPIGTSSVDKAMELHPEFFPTETEYEYRMSKVPQEVNDKWLEEVMSLHIYFDGEISPSKGIMYYANHPEEGQEWRDELSQKRNEFDYEEHERIIWNKHYASYGLAKPPKPTTGKIKS